MNSFERLGIFSSERRVQRTAARLAADERVARLDRRSQPKWRVVAQHGDEMALVVAPHSRAAHPTQDAGELFVVSLARLAQAPRGEEDSVLQRIVLEDRLDFEPCALMYSESGSMLLVVGHARCRVVLLSPRIRAELAQREPVVRDCKSLRVGERFLYVHNHVKIVQCAFHPLSPRHVVSLTSDNTLRIYNLGGSRDEPEQVFPLYTMLAPLENETSIGNLVDEDARLPVRAFAFGTDATAMHVSEASWNMLTIFFLLGDGEIYAACPILPNGCVFRESVIEQLVIPSREYLRQLTRGDTMDQQLVVGLLETQLLWLEEIQDEILEANHVLRTGVAGSNANNSSGHSRRHRSRRRHRQQGRRGDVDTTDDEDDPDDDQFDENVRGDDNDDNDGDNSDLDSDSPERWIRTRSPRSMQSRLVLLQGPLTEPVRSLDEADSTRRDTDPDCCDLLVLGVAKPNVVATISRTGIVRLLLGFEDVRPRWWPPQYRSRPLPVQPLPPPSTSLILYDTIDLEIDYDRGASADHCPWPQLWRDSNALSGFFVTHCAGVDAMRIDWHADMHLMIANDSRDDNDNNNNTELPDTPTSVHHLLRVESYDQLVETPVGLAQTPPSLASEPSLLVVWERGSNRYGQCRALDDVRLASASLRRASSRVSAASPSLSSGDELQFPKFTIDRLPTSAKLSGRSLSLAPQDATEQVVNKVNEWCVEKTDYITSLERIDAACRARAAVLNKIVCRQEEAINEMREVADEVHEARVALQSTIAKLIDRQQSQLERAVRLVERLNSHQNVLSNSEKEYFANLKKLERHVHSLADRAESIRRRTVSLDSPAGDQAADARLSQQRLDAVSELLIEEQELLEQVVSRVDTLTLESNSLET